MPPSVQGLLSILSVWLVVTLIGVLALPLTHWLLGRLPGRGLPFARAVGLLLAAYLFWLGVSLRLLPNNLLGCLAAILLLTGANAWILLRRQDNRAALREDMRRQGGRLLLSEALFLLAFLAWSALRAFAVDKIQPAGGEKFMEMAFLNGILTSPAFPPHDPWLAGFPIAYYYFGYIQMSLVTRLSGLPAGVCFELYDALLFAFALQLPFALVTEMVTTSGAGKRAANLAGLLAALFTAGMGNLQVLFEILYARGWLPPALSAWLALPDFPPAGGITGTFMPDANVWWWWRASRVINDLDIHGKGLMATPITEFPFFSFLLGDNHPHVLALPFALLAAALSLDWAQRGTLRATALPARLARLALAALTIGGLVFLNTWDFPIYAGLACLAFLTAQPIRTRAVWLETLERGAWLVGGALVFYLPFLLHFTSQAGGILPYVFPPTRLVQYLVMFGPFVFILACFLPAAVRAQQERPWPQVIHAWLRLAGGLALFFLGLIGLSMLFLWVDQLRGGLVARDVQSWVGGGSLAQGVLAILQARLANPWLFLALTALLVLAYALIRLAHGDAALRFAALLVLIALALSFSVEFFYLRDSFGVRMNTVFKFYFQAWLLLACSCAYATWWLARFWRGGPRKVFLLSVCIIAAICMLYPLLSILSRTQSFSISPTLDGTANLRRENPDDWAVIDWLKLNTPADKIPTLLEAPCRAYCYAGRISAFTGFPTLLGWSLHEDQWRGTPSEPNRREADISAIFTSANPNSLDLLRQWKVDLVVIGPTERDYVSAQCAHAETPCDPDRALANLESLLIPVYTQGTTHLYAVPAP